MQVKMNDQQQNEQDSGVRDQEIRSALDQHWAASDANDFDREHRIYHEDAVLDYQQSGERTRGEEVANMSENLSQARGRERWRDSKPQPWAEDTKRFFAAATALDEIIASGEPRPNI